VEFYKRISSFSPARITVNDLNQASIFLLILEQNTVDQKKLITETKENLKDLQQEIKNSLEFCFDSLKTIQIERENLIENIRVAREKEEKYNEIIEEKVEFETENDDDRQEIKKLEELMEIRDALQKKFEEKSKEEEETKQELQDKQLLLKESLEREEEAIRLSTLKDPQVEELGHWFKNCSNLIRNLNGIKSFNCISDTKLEVCYNGNMDIVATFSLVNNRPIVEVSMC
jgi:chromosome segregation ATPase